MTDSDDDLRPEIERQRKLQEAQQRRSQAPLQMTKLDSWSTEKLQDRPSTSEVGPDGATGKPKAGDKGATVKPGGAAAPNRPAHTRSFAELGVPGGLSKPAGKARGNGWADGLGRTNPDDPEAA
jgi:hypothetical protein